MTAIVRVRVQIIVHTIAVKQIVMEHVTVAQCFLALIVLAKEATLVVIVGVVAKNGVSPYALENAEGVTETALTVVLVPPIQELVENTV